MGLVKVAKLPHRGNGSLEFEGEVSVKGGVATDFQGFSRSDKDFLLVVEAARTRGGNFQPGVL